MNDTPSPPSDDGIPPTSEAHIPTASIPVVTEAAVPPPPGSAVATAGHPVAPSAPPPSSNRGLWIALAVVGGVVLLGILILVILVIVAFATARHWTKVDEPARPATYHSEQYPTGDFDVTDDHVNPCSVGQDWTDCINLLVDQYNGACVGTPLTVDGQAVCDAYSTQIDRMKGEDGVGVYVSTLGDYGHLTTTPEVATRQVSNDDARPARTHRATCYLGIIGECRGMPGTGTTSVVRRGTP